MPSSCDKAKLHQLFSKFGTIDKTYILYDHNSGSSRGFGFVEFCREEDVTRALQASISIDGKVLKCSRVILKQETKQNQLLEANPSSCCESNLNFPEKNNSQVNSNKIAKQKKKPKIQSCMQKDEYSSQDDTTKEGSQNLSCEKKDEKSIFNHLNSQQVYSLGYEQANVYEPAHYQQHQSEYNMFSFPQQTNYLEFDPQYGNLAAFDKGWDHKHQFGNSRFPQGSQLYQGLDHLNQGWHQSTTQSGSNRTYRTGMYQNHNQGKQPSYYKMF